MIKLPFIFLISLIFLYSQFSSGQEPTTLNIYSFAEYISSNTLKEFEDKDNIHVVYDVFDSDEMLDAKLLSGNTGYDVVTSASGHFLSSQIQLGLYDEIDKSHLRNYANLDKHLLDILSDYDPDVKHAVPWMWSVFAIGYNPDKIFAIDPAAPVNSLEIIFNPVYAEKFSKCGIQWLDSAPEMIDMALLYKKIHSANLTEKELEIAKEVLLSVRKYVKRVSKAEKYSDDLANGSTCLVIGWAGEILQSKARLGSGFDKVNVKYSIPKEGSMMYIDSFTILKTSKNKPDAYKFLDFLLDPRVAAKNAQYTMHFSANKAACDYMNPETKSALCSLRHVDFSKLYISNSQNAKIARKRNRMWTHIVAEVN